MVFYVIVNITTFVTEGHVMIKIMWLLEAPESNPIIARIYIDVGSVEGAVVAI